MTTKLDSAAVTRLDSLLSTSALVKIDKLIVSEDAIRGIDAKKSVALIAKTGLPGIDTRVIGINRLGVLSSRINLVKNNDGFAINMTESDKNDTDVTHLEIRSKNTKVQYRCASGESIKGVPKAIQDNLQWEITVRVCDVPLIAQAASAMTSEVVTIACKDGVVFFEFTDTNNDVFSTQVCDEAIWVDQGKTEPVQKNFCNYYPVAALIPLMKSLASDSKPSVITIGERGILNISVNDFDFFVLPQTV